MAHTVTSGDSLQLMPVSDGSGSSMATPVAVPGPLFRALIVKPTGEPALTVALSGSW